MKTIALVPMKLNSCRLPNKNIKSFTNGEPLCKYILRTLQEVQGIDEIYVYCSNPKIRDFLPSGIKYLSRSKELDMDSASMTDVLTAFAQDISADVYVMTHATAPFIKASSIQKGLDAVLFGGYDSSFAARKLQDFIWFDGKTLNYELEHIPRTQDLKPCLLETSGFYIYTNQVINNLKRRIGNNPYIVEVGEIEGIDIDEQEDFVIADAIFNYRIKRKNNEKNQGS